jgi:hypothetical protein
MLFKIFNIKKEKRNKEMDRYGNLFNELERNYNRINYYFIITEIKGIIKVQKRFKN